jgi:hypothetical protein
MLLIEMVVFVVLVVAAVSGAYVAALQNEGWRGEK